MSNKNESTKSYGSGITAGGIIAAMLSYAMFKSVGWAIVSFLFGWLYILYYLMVYGFTVGPNLPF